MKHNITKFFILQRQIFGVCPCCNKIFRLSDANIYLKKKPPVDWLEKVKTKEKMLEKRQERLDEKKCEMQELARAKGYAAARRAVRKIDPVFCKMGLDADDSKVVFHPIDFVVFKGLKDKDIKSIILLDGVKKDKRLQKSVSSVINKHNYEWMTLRVLDNGGVKAE